MRNFSKKLALLLVFATCYFFASAQKSEPWDLPVNSKSEKAVALFQQGIQAMNDVDFVKSTSSFNEALNEDPNFFMPYCMLATFNLYFGNTDEFKSLAQKAIAIKKLPKHEAIMQDALKKLLEDPESDLAEMGNQLVKMYPESLAAHQMLSTYQSINNNVEGVLQTNLAMLDLTDNDAPIYNMLGYSYMNLGKMDKAKEAFETYIKLAPENPNVYDSMGDYYMAAKEFDNAYKNFMKAHETNDAWSYNKAMKAKSLMEEDAIKAVIEKETQAYVNVDYQSWKGCYIQEEPFARLNSSKENWGGANNWASYDSLMIASYKNYTGEIPAPVKFKNENYIIRVMPEAAWAVYTENWYDKEGKKTGWNVNTRFLEKQNGEWRITFAGVHNAGSYEQTAQVENDNSNTGGFTVPQSNDTQKLQVAKMLGNNNIIAAINFAKSQGLTAEEYGEYEGNLFPWNKEDGFLKWINGFLNMNAAMSDVEILNQAENKITIRLSQIYPPLENQGQIMGVTFEEYLQWYNKTFTVIFNNLDCNYSQVTTDEGVEITITKK